MEISFSGLNKNTLEKKFVLIVVNLEVLKILKSWRHMCVAILFPNIRSTWRNGKEGIRGKRLVYAMLSSSFCSGVSVSRIYSYVCLYSHLNCCQINLLKQMSHNNVIMICTFGFLIWFVPSEFWYQCFLFYYIDWRGKQQFYTFFFWLRLADFF